MIILQTTVVRDCTAKHVVETAMWTPLGGVMNANVFFFFESSNKSRSRHEHGSWERLLLMFYQYFPLISRGRLTANTDGTFSFFFYGSHCLNIVAQSHIYAY